MKKNEQLDFWKGEFSEGYIERNSLNEQNIKDSLNVFKKILNNVNFESILELGSNIGINLLGIRKAFGENIKIYALEPNEKAFNILVNNKEIRIEKAFNCDGFKIPLPDNSIDLVFTNGVLIHINPKDLKDIMSEIIRVSKKYILCSEYFSHVPTSITYHGKENMLFKRDFGMYYLENFSNLKIVDYGFLWQEEFKSYDDLNWWLFEKINLEVNKNENM